MAPGRPLSARGDLRARDTTSDGEAARDAISDGGAARRPLSACGPSHAARSSPASARAGRAPSPRTTSARRAGEPGARAGATAEGSRAAELSRPAPLVRGTTRDRMLELNQLLEAALITKPEYEAKRKQILDAL